MTSSHDYKKDIRNKNIKIFINGKFFIRNQAKISVFDSGFLLGDGVWTGIRLHNNKLLFIKEHINRLFNDANSIRGPLPDIPTLIAFCLVNIRNWLAKSSPC